MATCKVWFITGASSGFGRTLTEHLLERGEIVVATLRKPEVIGDLTAQYGANKLLTIKLDVTRADEISDAFSKAKSAFGRIDVVFNNAGFGVLAEVEGTTDAVARAVFETNFWGAANVMKEAIKFFRDVNKPVGGRLLNVSSKAGFAVEPMMGYYGATKFALEGLTETLVAELDPDWNIKVTLLQFGMFETKIGSNGIMLPLHPAYTKATLPSVVARDQLSPSNLVLFGDTKKAMAKVYQLGWLEDPPLHLPIGKDSVDGFKAKLATMASEVGRFGSWSDDLLREGHKL